MRRLASFVSTASKIVLAGSVILGSTFGCATYHDDLVRARGHYDANQHEKALALFRVLEADIDSLSPGEQAQYAYLRGMTDYRLAGSSLTTNVSGGAADPKKAYRTNARHWLAIAAAIEKETPGGLKPDEKARLEESLTDLNKDVYGGAESIEDGAKKDEKKPAEGAAAPDAPAK
ncbi:MAG TPA: hypothetical protein PKA58_14620 [Polyangium sp.]|nr:hypothetical protein [Polyangium sp.]